MQPEFDPRLESLIDGELKQLPPVPAPSGLLPGVMSAIAARARVPWWQRSWWDWPLVAKAAFLVLAIGLAGAFSSGGWLVESGMNSYSQQMTEHLAPVTSRFEALLTLANAAHQIVESLGQPFLIYAAVTVGALYLFCLGLGTACVQFVRKSA